MKEDYQKALVYELIASAGANRDNKENVRRVHKMLLATIYPEIEKYEKERDDSIKQLIDEEHKKSYQFRIGGKPLTDDQIGMIGK